MVKNLSVASVVDYHLNNGGVPSGKRSVNVEYPIKFTHWLYDMQLYPDEFTEWYTDQNNFFTTDLCEVVKSPNNAFEQSCIQKLLQMDIIDPKRILFD